MAFKTLWGNYCVNRRHEGRRGNFLTGSLGNCGRSESDQKTSGLSKEECLGLEASHQQPVIPGAPTKADPAQC